MVKKPTSEAVADEPTSQAVADGAEYQKVTSPSGFVSEVPVSIVEALLASGYTKAE